MTVLLYRHAPNISRRFHYPYPPAQPFPTNPRIPSSISKSGNWIEQARQVMAAAEQMRPLIDQYGPYVKNLPAMWKLYRAVQSAPDPDDTSPREPVKEEAKKEIKQEVKTEIKKTSESIPWFPGRIS
ncbi:hypothetical protein BTO30_05295 [Domibacillus antri]|uniref:Uncharacterized protein n=1 Tax=Domibacillus antri TaxID=1714264 RepID=A0A1Q8Q7R4_9BACI|nr:hypothetical protein BTO30_05295 [Domibacillus antri]